MRAQLNGIPSEPPDPSPLDDPVVSSGALVLSHGEARQLVDSFKTIGNANLELIDELQLTEQRMGSLMTFVRRVTVLGGASIIVFSFIIFVVFYRSGEGIEEARASRRDVALVAKDVRTTLTVVRANAQALAYKVRADVAMLPPESRSPADERAVDAADEAARGAARAESEVKQEPLVPLQGDAP